ncbi:hypothetical protein G9A89_020041 [Geosiphon pyriformis]|nr:hypothetical protein G9A89_020041 [Geosiphon pyriformis]
MDRSLKSLNTVGCRTGAAVFFEDIGLGLGIGVLSLISSTLAEMQAIVLALDFASLVAYGHFLAFKNNIWLVCAKHCAYMEKNGLIPLDGFVLILVSGLTSGFSAVGDSVSVCIAT